MAHQEIDDHLYQRPEIGEPTKWRVGLLQDLVFCTRMDLAIPPDGFEKGLQFLPGLLGGTVFPTPAATPSTTLPNDWKHHKLGLGVRGGVRRVLGSGEAEGLVRKWKERCRKLLRERDRMSYIIYL